MLLSDGRVLSICLGSHRSVPEHNYEMRYCQVGYCEVAHDEESKSGHFHS